MKHVLPTILLLAIVSTGCSPVAAIPSVESIGRITFDASVPDDSEFPIKDCEFGEGEIKKVHSRLMNRKSARDITTWPVFGDLDIVSKAGRTVRVSLFIIDLPATANSRVAYRCHAQDEKSSAYYVCGTFGEFITLIQQANGERAAHRKAAPQSTE